MGWIILGIVALIIAVILWFPVRIGLAYGEEGFSGWFNLLFWKIPVFPVEKEEEEELTPGQKRRRAKKAAQREKKKAGKKKSGEGEKEKAPKKKRSLGEWIELIAVIAQSGGRLARRFWKGFRINGLRLRMAVAGSNAAETAIAYGKINAAVYSAYALAERIVTLRRTDIRIVPDFLSEESRVEVSGELFFRVGTLLAAVCSGGFYFLKRFLSMSGAGKKQGKKEPEAARQPV